MGIIFGEEEKNKVLIERIDTVSDK